MSAALYIVATPIGNLADMSPRAIETLRTVDVIAAEDTRHSAHLMREFDIKTPMLAYHEHAGESQTRKLLEMIQSGKSIALISDAGTPLISDPGYPLVAEAHALNIPVHPIPGSSAIIAALCASGLPTFSFTFEGFLPAKSAARLTALEALKDEKRTMVYYEAPHRILDMLKDLEKVFGQDRRVTLARELTKTFETIRQSTLDELIDWVSQDANQQKGEIVLVVAGASAVAKDEMPKEAKSLAESLARELPPKKAAKLVAAHCDLANKTVYEYLLGLKNR